MELLEVPEPEAVGVEPEPPTSELEVLLPLLLEADPLRVPVLTVPLLDLPEPESPVARGAEPPAFEEVGMNVGVPAGEVATAG